MDPEARKALSHFSASFAKWRWGTLNTVCRELIRIMPWVALVFFVGDFRQAEEIGKVAGAVSAEGPDTTKHVAELIALLLPLLRGARDGP